MMTIREDAGASLAGAIDGINAIYKTTYDMRLDRVIDVFVNGLCRMASLDNGYILQDSRTLEMREVLLPGDTLSVRYNCSPVQVGVEEARPDGLTVADDSPEQMTAVGEDSPAVFSATLSCGC